MPSIEKITLATLICLLSALFAAWLVIPRASPPKNTANAEILCLEDAAKHLPPGTPPTVACPSF